MKYKLNNVLVSSTGIKYDYAIIPETFKEFLELVNSKINSETFLESNKDNNEI